MAKWLLVVETNANDEAREAEFNEWYDKTHLPDVLKTPGFISATRYELTEPAEGKSKFLALYDVEADSVDEAKKALSDNAAKWREAGRLSKLLAVGGLGWYRPISSLSR